MIVYRLSQPRFGHDLHGTGAAMFGGRWNSIGNFLLYTAQTSSLSILEHVVHVIGAEPAPYLLSTIEIKNEVEVFPEEKLPHDWKTNENLTQRIGDKWLLDNLSAALTVPSVINPLESNILINPNHPSLELRIVNQNWHIHDARLVSR